MRFTPLQAVALVLAAALLVGAAIAYLAPSGDEGPPAAASHDGMAEDERCAHMPEHCEGA